MRVTDIERPDIPILGTTHDQIVADAISGNARYRMLNYCIQKEPGVNGNGSAGSRVISWREQNGALDIVENVTSPEQAYQTLFTGFGNPDPKEAAKAQALLKRRQSVLDLVRGRRERLLPLLGKADADRIARHFDEIRALEMRLAALTLPTGAECRQFPDPGEPAPAGEEDKRAEIFGDLLHMAIACDLSRVATFQFFWMNSTASAKVFAGVDDNMHDIGHRLQATEVPDRCSVLAFQVKHFARLVAKLKSTPDVDGTKLLDNTALVMIFEGGYGYDPYTGGAPDKHSINYNVHSTENMCALVSGRAGGLKPGKHIVATDVHPAQAIISAMQAVGVTQGGEPRLGEVSGIIPGLFA
jgi:hypothetical protein